MWTHLSQPKPPLHLHHGRFLISFVFVTALAAATFTLFKFQPDGISAAGFLFLSLLLLGALGVGREFSTPSFKELAFYFIAIVAAGMIWPAANLAVSAYRASGYIALAAFMAFVFPLAIGLGVLSVKLLVGHDGEKDSL